VSRDAANIGLLNYHLNVTNGQDVTDATVVGFTYNSVRSKPYSPVHLKGVRATAGDISLTWVRRARIANDWVNNIDVPLDENAEQYRIRLYDALPSNGGILYDIIANVFGTPAYTITAATINLWYGSPTATVYLTVTQVSTVVGDGYENEKTFT